MKRTKKELAERKAKAAEIAALYNTVANGGRMQECRAVISEGKTKWPESDGPTLSSELSLFRAIPAPRKPEPKKPEPRTWWLRISNNRVIAATSLDPAGRKGEWIKVREVQP